GDGGVVRRAPALEDLRGGGGGHVDRGEDVLVRDRHPGERAEPLPLRPALVDGAGLLERGLRRDVQERVDLRLDLGDAVEVRLGHLHGGDLAGRDHPAEFGGGLPDQLAHASSPRMRGTRKRSSSTAGAWSSACCGVRPGRTSSGRKTLVSGSACEDGGMSSVATSAPRATAAMIWSSGPAKWSSSSSVSASRDNRAR